MAASAAQLLAMDEGGNLGHGVGLEQAAPSPAVAFDSMGTASFVEPLTRYSAGSEATDRRKERRTRGVLRFQSEPRVPDVGGLGWRTSSGHLLKNQAYYCQRPGVNKWDQPTHAGVESWRHYHGPKMRMDANTMERLDRHDREQEDWEAKRTFVNTSRVETLDRFYSRKLERVNQEHASSWAPHRRTHREVHNRYDTFDGCLDEKPQKQLRKIITAKVMERDRQAVRSIAARVQQEETWKMVWKEMEQERRADLREGLRERQLHTDRLMALSGQPLRVREGDGDGKGNGSGSGSGLGGLPMHGTSERSQRLAQPVKQAKAQDVTALTDFAGLIHTANNAQVLESLLPGQGHVMSQEFREDASRSAEPGWPPPPPADTPRVKGTSRSIAPASATGEMSLAKASIPVPAERFQHNIGSRHNPDMLVQHSQVQYLRTEAPPPPDQGKTVLKEDWSPAATLPTGSGRAAASTFSRTDASTPLGALPQKAGLPAPTRPVVYPVLCETSPSSPASPSSAKPWQEALPEAAERLRRHVSSPANLQRSSHRQGTTAANTSAGPVATKELCEELDGFEENLRSFTKAPLVNFFGTPKGVGRQDSRRTLRPKEEGAGDRP